LCCYGVLKHLDNELQFLFVIFMVLVVSKYIYIHIHTLCNYSIIICNYNVIICNYLQVLLMLDHGRACFYCHLISLWSSCTVRNQLLQCYIAFYSMFFHDLVFFICMGLSTSCISASGFIIC
jgi:hypothetical protein